jgi:hypothetical protein
MTPIDNETVERLANFLRGAAPNADGDWWGDVAAREKGKFWWRKYLREIERLHYAALDAAEARERAAVAAAYEKAAASLEERGSDGWAEHVMADYASVNADAIRALSDTDALAEYVEKVRAEERERCLQLVEEYRQRAEARAEVTRGVGKHDATKGHEGQAAAAVSIAAAIRQETNDG